jgi:hypothetical protein
VDSQSAVTLVRYGGGFLLCWRESHCHHRKRVFEPEVLHVKRTILLLAGLSLLAMMSVSCGTTHLENIELTAPSSELIGEGGTLQLTATGYYSYGPPNNLTAKVTYTVVADGDSVNSEGTLSALPAPPSNITINSDGMLTAVDPFVCTFVPGNTTGTTVVSWVLTGSYKITATYGGITSQPFYVAMASAGGIASAPANGQCGPS